MVKLLKTKKRTVVYETEKYSVGRDKSIELIVSKQNGKVTDYHFFSKFSFIPNGKSDCNLSCYYYYYNDKIFNEFKTKCFSEINFENFIIPFKDFKDEQIDFNRVLCPYYEDHMVFCIGNLYPIPTVMTFDYICGINNTDYHLDEVYEYLKSNPFVIDIEKEEIPYYNRRSNHTHGLKMKVIFSQKVFNKMWYIVRKNNCSTTVMRNMVVCSPYIKTTDPLGIKKFRKTEKEKKQEELKYETGF